MSRDYLASPGGGKHIEAGVRLLDRVVFAQTADVKFYSYVAGFSPPPPSSPPLICPTVSRLRLEDKLFTIM